MSVEEISSGPIKYLLGTPHYDIACNNDQRGLSCGTMNYRDIDAESALFGIDDKNSGVPTPGVLPPPVSIQGNVAPLPEPEVRLRAVQRGQTVDRFSSQHMFEDPNVAFYTHFGASTRLEYKQ